jgi:serine/threonine protein kinase
MTPSAGRFIAGRYILEERLGEGAMGTVWRAHDQLLDRRVALKEVLLDAAIDEYEMMDRHERMKREARTAARLNHPNIVTVYDVIENDGYPWIVMEFVAARSLHQILVSAGPLAPVRAARIGQQLLAALAAAHKAGVLHRDVKPSNVLIAPEISVDGRRGERAVLTDFGIAQFEGDDRLTLAGTVVGTQGFIAPERMQGASATPASDLWSLGATLYQAVEGHGPYERVDVRTSSYAILYEDAPPAASAGRLGPLLIALLQRDPGRRPLAREAARMFADLLTPMPGAPEREDTQPSVLPPPPAPPPPAWSPSPRSPLSGQPTQTWPSRSGQAAAPQAAAPQGAATQAAAPQASATPQASAAQASAPRAATPATGPRDAGPQGAPTQAAQLSAAGPPASGLPASGPPAAGPPVPPGGGAGTAAGAPEHAAGLLGQLDREAGHAPRPGRRGHGRGLARKPVLIAAGSAGAAAIAVAVLLFAAHPFSGPNRPAAATRPASSAAASPASAPSAPASSAPASSASASSAATTGTSGSLPTTAPTAGPSAAVVKAINDHTGMPAGYQAHTVRVPGGKTGGFSIGTPPGWTVSPAMGQSTFQYALDSQTYLEIDLAQHTTGNMVAQANSLARQDRATYPGYQRIAGSPPKPFILSATILGTPGALWQFDFGPSPAALRRVDILLFTWHQQSYTITMTAPAGSNDSLWNTKTLVLMTAMLHTFKPLAA